MKPYPDWFEHTRCSRCEHLDKKTITCNYAALICHSSNNYKHFKERAGLKDLKGNPGKALPAKALPPCTHPNLIPHMFESGKREYNKNHHRIDWHSNIINSHYIRVCKYWCPTCNIFLTPPSSAKD